MIFILVGLILFCGGLYFVGKDSKLALLAAILEKC